VAAGGRTPMLATSASAASSAAPPSAGLPPLGDADVPWWHPRVCVDVRAGLHRGKAGVILELRDGGASCRVGRLAEGSEAAPPGGGAVALLRTVDLAPQAAVTGKACYFIQGKGFAGTKGIVAVRTEDDDFVCRTGRDLIDAADVEFFSRNQLVRMADDE